jgi:hypothetical protein
MISATRTSIRVKPRARCIGSVRQLAVDQNVDARLWNRLRAVRRNILWCIVGPQDQLVRPGLVTQQQLKVAHVATGVEDSDGVVDYGGRRWEWHQKIERLALAGLRRIDVSVRLVPDAGATSTAGNAEKTYLVTASSVLGTAVAVPRGDTPDWEPAGGPPGPGNPNAPLAPAPPATGT